MKRKEKEKLLLKKAKSKKNESDAKEELQELLEVKPGRRKYLKCTWTRKFDFLFLTNKIPKLFQNS